MKTIAVRTPLLFALMTTLVVMLCLIWPLPITGWSLTTQIILIGLGVLMLGFAALGWVRRLWSLAGRLHYSLLAFSGISLLWVLWYWNLL